MSKKMSLAATHVVNTLEVATNMSAVTHFSKFMFNLLTYKDHLSTATITSQWWSLLTGFTVVHKMINYEFYVYFRSKDDL